MTYHDHKDDWTWEHAPVETCDHIHQQAVEKPKGHELRFTHLAGESQKSSLLYEIVVCIYTYTNVKIYLYKRGLCNINISNYMFMYK